jgi:hypothetical protein
MKIGLVLPWTVILNEVKDLLYVFDLFETKEQADSSSLRSSE